MGRYPTSSSYITPILSTGVVQEQSASGFGRGAFTLVAGSTYFFPIGGADAPFLASHCQWDASLVLTSITLEDCNFPEGDVPSYNDGAGEWIDEDPSTAFVGTKGAGVTVTNGVVAVAGGAAGGCMFHAADSGAKRTRLKVVVGGTGGAMRVASWGKE